MLVNNFLEVLKREGWIFTRKIFVNWKGNYFLFLFFNRLINRKLNIEKNRSYAFFSLWVGARVARSLMCLLFYNIFFLIFVFTSLPLTVDCSNNMYVWCKSKSGALVCFFFSRHPTLQGLRYVCLNKQQRQL